MKVNNATLECLICEFEIRIYRVELSAETDIGTVSIKAYIVADEASGFMAENPNGTRNPDVAVCATLNEALGVWKVLLHGSIDNFHF